MKTKLAGSILTAILVVGSLGTATTLDQQQNTASGTVTMENTGLDADHPEQAVEHNEPLQETLNKKEGNLPEPQAQDILELQKKLKTSDATILEFRKKLQTADATLQKVNEKFSTAQQKLAGMKDLQEQLAEAQSSVQEMEKKLKESELTIHDLQSQLDAVAAVAEKPLTINECDTLKAQVTGLQMIVQENNAALEKNIEERNSWEINKDLLINQIKELQNKKNELLEKNRTLMRDLAAAGQ